MRLSIAQKNKRARGTIAVCVVGCATAVLAGVPLLLGVVPTGAQTVDSAALRAAALQRTNSLKTVTVPDPSNVTTFIRPDTCATAPSVPQPCGREALQVLGKALFWDQQVGSDGQACASCHFHAGADNRSKNQLNPGLRNQTPGANTGAFNDLTGFGPNTNHFGPNYPLTAGDFPFHHVSNPDVNPELDPAHSAVMSDTNDIASSQGVFNAAESAPFAFNPLTGIDTGTPSLTGFGTIFNVGGVLVRNVEPRNTPTVINTVMNHRNFWDARARNKFNGVNPLGDLDPTVRVVKVVLPGKPTGTILTQVSIANCSACSQADGPPGSDLEMAFPQPHGLGGRRFADIGRKMLHPSLVALGQQVVAPGTTGDSVLASYSKAPANGISKKYADLIQGAFLPMWWNSPDVVDLSSGQPVLKPGPHPSTADQFTVMQYNFSLYFGLAVNAYERLLLANDTPFDQFMDGVDTPVGFQDPEKRGLQLFLTQGRCSNCHGGPELTNASLTNVQKFETLERMIMGDNQVAVYDNGHYNIGVRPTLEDLGIGATIGPLNQPLSNSRLYQNCVQDAVRRLSALTPPPTPEKTLRSANLQCNVPRILARPAEAATLLARAAALLPDGNSTRTAAEALIAAAERLLAAVPPDPVTASCELAKNPALPCPTTTNNVQADGALDLLASALSPQHPLLQAASSLLPDPVVPGTATKLLAPLLQPQERVAVDGAHKVPALRNVELTAPYFHNGGMADLMQVVEFYNRGGNFPVTNRQNLDVDIQPIGLSAAQRADLVAFLKSLTDERVRYDKAPFDHPSLSIPNGGQGDDAAVAAADPLGLFSPGAIADDRIELPAVGKHGNGVGLGTPHTPFANFLDPLQ